MLILLYFLLYCIGAGLAVTAWLWHASHKEENAQRFEADIYEFSEDLKIAEEDCIAIMYIAALFLGFAILPVALFRRILKFVKGDK